jgi:hypothetical protein
MDARSVAKILCVEGDPAVRESRCAVLKYSGYDSPHRAECIKKITIQAPTAGRIDPRQLALGTALAPAGASFFRPRNQLARTPGRSQAPKYFQQAKGGQPVLIGICEFRFHAAKYSPMLSAGG